MKFQYNCGFGVKSATLANARGKGERLDFVVGEFQLCYERVEPCRNILHQMQVPAGNQLVGVSLRCSHVTWISKLEPFQT